MSVCVQIPKNMQKLVKEAQETDWNLLPQQPGCNWRDFALHSGRQGKKSWALAESRKHPRCCGQDSFPRLQKTSQLKFNGSLLEGNKWSTPLCKEVFFHKRTSYKRTCLITVNFHLSSPLWQNILLSQPISSKHWAFWDFWGKAGVCVFAWCWWWCHFHFKISQYFTWTWGKLVFMLAWGKASVGKETLPRHASAIFLSFTYAVIWQHRVDMWFNIES